MIIIENIEKKFRILKQKADKRDLDLKVNKKTFDENMNDVSNSINGCIAKNTSLVCFYNYLLYIMIKLMLTRPENIIQEDEWRKGSEKIFKELENKLDRLELNSLKDYIEKQLKKLKKLQVGKFKYKIEMSCDDFLLNRMLMCLYRKKVLVQFKLCQRLIRKTMRPAWGDLF